MNKSTKRRHLATNQLTAAIYRKPTAANIKVSWQAVVVDPQMNLQSVAKTTKLVTLSA